MAVRVRVNVPRNPEELLELSDAVYKKHLSLGKNSPLGMLPWSKVGPSIDKAMENHQSAGIWKKHTIAGTAS